MEKPAPHRHELDILRLIACFLVIVNHTNSRIFLGISPSPTWFVSLFIFYLSKIGVPLFILSSGAVLLGRAEPYGQVFRRLGRLLAVLALATLGYHVLGGGGLTPAALWEAAAAAWRWPIQLHLWYLYMYLGLLLMLPPLRRMTAGFDRPDYRYFIGWALIFPGLAPLVAHFAPGLAPSQFFILPFFHAYLGLFVLGYYLTDKAPPPPNPRRTIALSAALPGIMAALLVLGTWLEYRQGAEKYTQLYDNVALLPITLSAGCLFWLVGHLAGRRSPSPRAAGVLAELGRCTFGAYLLSMALIRAFSPLYLALHRGGLHQLIAMGLYQAAVFAAGLALAFGLRKIPVLRKLL